MRNLFRLTMLIVLLVIVGSGVMAVYTVFLGGRTVAVPSLEGLSVIDAVDRTQTLGLLVRVDQVESLQPAGTILGQWPGPGEKVKPGKILVLKVSRGGTRLSLPDVRGMEFTQATARLEEEGFKAGDVLRIHDDGRPAGVVVAQSPAAPTMMSPGRTIDLLVSLGPKSSGGMVVVPDAVGRSETIARKLISEAGLTVRAVNAVYSQASPEGLVTRLDPAPGAKVPSGSAVTLTVATLKKPPTVQPPKVPGLASEQTPAEIVATQTKPEAGPTTVPVPVATPPGTAEQKTTPSESKPAVVPETPTGPQKTAKIRYQVPPLTRPMELKIEIVDAAGTRELLNREVKGGEYLTLDAPYRESAAVTIYLGGMFVWQDRYR